MSRSRTQQPVETLGELRRPLSNKSTRQLLPFSLMRLSVGCADCVTSQAARDWYKQLADTRLQEKMSCAVTAEQEFAVCIDAAIPTTPRMGPVLAKTPEQNAPPLHTQVFMTACGSGEKVDHNCSASLLELPS